MRIGIEDVLAFEVKAGGTGRARVRRSGVAASRVCAVMMPVVVGFSVEVRAALKHIVGNASKVFRIWTPDQDWSHAGAGASNFVAPCDEVKSVRSPRAVGSFAIRCPMRLTFGSKSTI